MTCEAIVNRGTVLRCLRHPVHSASFRALRPPPCLKGDGGDGETVRMILLEAASVDNWEK
jgi:hypothetical protein